MRGSLFILILFSTLAYGQSKPIALEGKSLGNIPIRVLGSAKYQNATFGSIDKSTVNPRHLNGLGAEAMAGLVVGPVFLGGGGEYMYWLQATDPKDKSDLTGNSTKYYAAAGFALGNVLLLGKYIFQASYQVNKKDSNGDKTTYSSPEGVLGASLVFRFKKQNFWGIEYNSMTYGKSKVGGTTSSLSHDQKMKLTSVGISVGVMF